MKTLLTLALFFLTSCAMNSPLGDDTSVVQAVPAVKQKQKIALLQKKLEHAEKEQKRAEEEVERLNDEVHEAQLVLVRKQVASAEEQIKKLQSDPRKYAQLIQLEASTLFLKEREMLHELIQTGPSPSAFEAQVVLDRILGMITELSNEIPL